MGAPSRSIRGPGNRTGSTSGARVDVPNLAEFRRELRQLENPRRWTRELAAEQRVIAKSVAGAARFEAASMGGEQRHFASAIKGRGTVTGARIQIDGLAGSDGAFWGAKQYRQFNPWVGNSWSAGVAGQGPYAINDTIAEMQDEIQQMYLDGVRRVIDSSTSYWTDDF